MLKMLINNELSKHSDKHIDELWMTMKIQMNIIYIDKRSYMDISRNIIKMKIKIQQSGICPALCVDRLLDSDNDKKCLFLDP